MGDRLLKPTVLIVDDDEDNREVLRDMLEDDGYRVLLASNGQEALRKVTLNVEILLVDVVMPVMDGLSTCKELRENPQTAELPVLVLTAYDEPSIRDTALDNGAYDFLVKPVRASELRIKVGALARLSQTAKPEHRRKLYQEMVRQETRMAEREEAEALSQWADINCLGG